jgi:hypothetical protein
MCVLLARLKIFRATGIWKSRTRSKSWTKTDDTIQALETAYAGGANMTTRALATIAVRNAMLDAELKAFEIDGMLSYQSNDSVFSPFVAGAVVRRTAELANAGN